jgi:hypothetical protein
MFYFPENMLPLKNPICRYVTNPLTNEIYVQYIQTDN